MPSKRRIPSYRLHKPTGQAVVTLNGKDIYLGKHGTPESRDLYDRLIGEWLQNHRVANPALIDDGPCIAEICKAYLEHADSYYRQPDGKPGRSVERMERAIRFLRRKYGFIPAKQFGPLALKSLRQQFIDKGYCRTYCNHLTKTIKQIFKWAASEQLVPIEVYQALTTVEGLKRGRTTAPEPKPITSVSDALIDLTLPHLPPIVADMVRLQRLIGCRPGEIVMLRPHEINRTGDIWIYEPAHHKTAWRGKGRVITFGPRAQAILMPYLDRPEDAYCFSPAEGQKLWHLEKRRKRKTKVQPSQVSRKKKDPRKTPGDHYTTASYGRAIRRLCLKHDIPVWSPNQLRKAAAVAIRERFSLEHAKSVLGHEETTTTEKFYAELDLQRAIEVAREMG